LDGGRQRGELGLLRLQGRLFGGELGFERGIV